MTTLLIDGDIVAYRHACAVERAVEWAPGQFTYVADADEAWDLARADMEDLMQKAGASSYIVALSHAENFRKRIYPAYKAPRKSSRKPLCLAELRRRLLEAGAQTLPGLEADDVLGILMTSPHLAGRKVLWSTDKDLLQIPGEHLDGDRLVLVTEPDGDYRHALQTLTGDRVDNFPGLPGCGPTKASALLRPFLMEKPPFFAAPEAWREILRAFKGNEEEMLTQARLARILRASDYNFETKEPILWMPPW